MSRNIGAGPSSFFLINPCEEIRSYLPNSWEEVKTVTNSAPVAQLSHAFFRNLYYTVMAKSLGINSLFYTLSTRITYLEAGLMCLASAAYNLFFCGVYSMLVVINFGFSTNITEDCCRHWQHVLHGLSCAKIALMGTFFSSFSTDYNRYVYKTWSSLKANYQKDIDLNLQSLLNIIKEVIASNSSTIFELTRIKTGSDRVYGNVVRPQLLNIEHQLQNAQTVDDLIKLAADVWDRLPKLFEDSGVTSPDTVDLKALYPFITSLSDAIFKHLPQSAEMTKTFVNSAAIAQISHATLKVFPGMLLRGAFEGSSYSFFLSDRVAYLEAATLSIVSIIHNIFFAVIYSGLVVMTLGFPRTLNNDCIRHWSHLFYGIYAIGAGVIGAIYPYFGGGANALVVQQFSRSLLHYYHDDINVTEEPFLKSVKEIFKKNRKEISDFFHSKFPRRFQSEFGPSINCIEKKLNACQKMDNLIELLYEILRFFPKMGVKDTNESVNINH